MTKPNNTNENIIKLLFANFHEILIDDPFRKKILYTPHILDLYSKLRFNLIIPYKIGFLILLNVHIYIRYEVIYKSFRFFVRYFC